MHGPSGVNYLNLLTPFLYLQGFPFPPVATTLHPQIISCLYSDVVRPRVVCGEGLTDSRRVKRQGKYSGGKYSGKKGEKFINPNKNYPLGRWTGNKLIFKGGLMALSSLCVRLTNWVSPHTHTTGGGGGV